MGTGFTAKPANEVTPDSQPSKPASGADEVSPDSGAIATPQAPCPQTSSGARSACEPFREEIESALSKGRNAKAIWQDLVDTRGFSGSYQSVKRFLRNLRGKSSPEACAVIETAPGEDYGKSRVMVRGGGDPSLLGGNLRRDLGCTLHSALQSFEPLDEAR